MPFNRMRRGRNQMRFRSGRNPIQSRKYQVAEKVSYLANANQQVTLAQGVEIGTAVTTNQVPVGAMIYSVDVSVNFTSESGGTTGNWEFFLIKLRSGQSIDTNIAATSAGDWSNLGQSSIRNQIIKSYMGQIGTDDGTILQRNIHIPIPKMFQRTREGDFLVLSFNASIGGASSIGFRYKTYT